ncbi:protein EARLY RESPONSIVE TO DEHYDRATION 15 isoform X1 [Prunus avium]|uniref:Protein EARLY RESPONSIVE TO DEHYDRATION 15 isoform X1 n=1 Tax=Prunus avium TaxID=42229 RepID=A0A6P5TT51_PRUAV|nr:protein EARLY RESPONSIVE TO DEHYDRATION 15 isoform X1 [Prunus avium]
MALVSGGSTLNPNAPLFIPAALRQVEDFSPEWWQLVTTSTWYHDYWLSQQGEDGFYDNAQGDFDNVADLLPETFDLDAGEDFSSLEAQFEEFLQLSQTESKTAGLETSTAVLKNLKSLEDRRSPVEPRRYAEKPAKHVSPKCSPRFIQQPR